MRQIVWFSVALVAVAACGGKASTGGQAPAPAAAPKTSTTSSEPARKSGPNLIMMADIQKQQFRNAEEVVQRLRPQWLRTRGSTSFRDTNGESTLPVVYIDDMKFGPLSSLAQIPIAQISELHLISPSDATTRWGNGLLGGVILVITPGKATR